MVLGWDIGIKNLTYCNVIETEDNNDYDVLVNERYFKINDWNNINLVNKLDELNSDDSGKEKEKEKELNEASNNILTMLGCEDNKDVNIGNIKIVKKKGPKKKEEVKGKKKKKKSATKLNLTLLGKALYMELNDKKDISNTDVVLLENQPVLKNPTMKSVQMLVYGYFVMKSCDEKTTIKDIKCYAASNKIKLTKYASKEFMEKLNKDLANVKRKYDKNKKTAIALTGHFLNNESKWYKELFKDSKKKDDLADALLMSIHYILTNKNK